MFKYFQCKQTKKDPIASNSHKSISPKGPSILGQNHLLPHDQTNNSISLKMAGKYADNGPGNKSPTMWISPGGHYTQEFIYLFIKKLTIFYQKCNNNLSYLIAIAW